MAVYAVKRGDESNDALQKRFKNQVQNLGHLAQIRQKKVFRKNENKRMVRQAALKREQYRSGNRKKQFYSNM